jgi:hypothetical protein
MLAYRVGVPLVYNLATCVQTLIDLPEKFRQIITFYGWAMLGSNQRPLPCEGTVMVC